MARETSKCKEMREARGDFDTFLHGRGIDIGSGNDLLQVKSGTVIPWDKEQGDAMYLKGVDDNSLDFVYSSHCLEHLVNMEVAIGNWSRVLKIGGYAYIVVPDYLHYEKCRWPSAFNGDHKRSFSLDITREIVKRTNHWHIARDVEPVLSGAGLDLFEYILEVDGYDWNNGHLDQTIRGALSQICFVAKKRR